MATGKGSRKFDAPPSIAAMLALHFAGQDRALGIRSGTKTRRMLAYYLVLRQKYTNLVIEAAALNGSIKAYKAQVDALVKKGVAGQADIEDVKRAATFEKLAEMAVKKLEFIEKAIG